MDITIHTDDADTARLGALADAAERIGWPDLAAELRAVIESRTE